MIEHVGLDGTTISGIGDSNLKDQFLKEVDIGPKMATTYSYESNTCLCKTGTS